MIHLVDLAKSYIGTPYVWTGNSVLSGFDCSGFICELLRSTGFIGREDLSAQMIYDLLDKQGLTPSDKVGSLAFYGESIIKINHIAFHIDRYRVIEAGGGDSTCTSKEIAIQKGACVRIRPVKYRKDFLVSAYPNYSCIGLI